MHISHLTNHQLALTPRFASVHLWKGVKSVVVPPRHTNRGVPLVTWGRVGMTSVMANVAQVQVTGSIDDSNTRISAFPSREVAGRLVRLGSHKTL